MAGIAENKARQNMSPEQKELLVTFVTKNPKLIAGKFKAQFTYKDSQRLWETCASCCNAAAGAKKDWKMWRKAWQYLKSQAKAKKAAINREKGTRGGGPNKNIVFRPGKELIDRLIFDTEACGNAKVEEAQCDFLFVDSELEASLGGNGAINDAVEVSINNRDNEDEEITSSSSETIQPSSSSKTDDKLGQKDKPTEKHKKLSIPAQRLKKSVAEAARLVDVSRKKVEIEEFYYERKLDKLDSMCSSIEQMASAQESSWERIANSMERIVSAQEMLARARKEEYPTKYLDM